MHKWTSVLQLPMLHKGGVYSIVVLRSSSIELLAASKHCAKCVEASDHDHAQTDYYHRDHNSDLITSRCLAKGHLIANCGHITESIIISGSHIIPNEQSSCFSLDHVNSYYYNFKFSDFYEPGLCAE